ncbi:MAG: glycine oxidase ThiO [Chromatiaceae bacterium]|nr:glycine oxidase ThiO [Chromatiaceae bacterium]MCP5421942.1 glycine oxidase ThiO [Chromatiaceae bacterium]
MNRILVIGGGAVGMLTALELREAGHSVVLFERGATGRESSWAGGGIVSPLFPWRYLDSVTRLASWSQAHYPAFCERIARPTGVDPEYTASGLILIAPDEHDQATRWAEQHGRVLQVIDRARFAALEPRAAHPVDGALWMPEVGQVRNPRLVRALRIHLERLGVTLRTGDGVHRLLVDDGRCRGVAAESGEHTGDRTVVCAGAWSGGLLDGLPDPPAIHPLRGQMLMFRAPPGTITRMVLEANRYVIPRRDGRTLFGSTIEDVGFDKSTTAEARAELFQIATERFPVLRDCVVEAHWAGLRPSSPAGVPFIGRHPRIADLYVNAGHFRNGIVLGLASARLAADLVLGREPIVDPSPYAWTAARG